MDGQNPISNTDDVIDSRDVIARIEYLKDEFRRVTGDEPDDYEMGEDDWAYGLGNDDAHELVALLALAEEGGTLSDWRYGETLIRDDYFEDYARELAEDIGAIDREASWPLYAIDWGRAARDLRMDYTSLDFDGVTYWGRS